jgi:hypothetical protein
MPTKKEQQLTLFSEHRHIECNRLYLEVITMQLLGTVILFLVGLGMVFVMDRLLEPEKARKSTIHRKRKIQ